MPASIIIDGCFLHDGFTIIFKSFKVHNDHLFIFIEELIDQFIVDARFFWSNSIVTANKKIIAGRSIQNIHIAFHVYKGIKPGGFKQEKYTAYHCFFPPRVRRNKLWVGSCWSLGSPPQPMFSRTKVEHYIKLILQNPWSKNPSQWWLLLTLTYQDIYNL